MQTIQNLMAGVAAFKMEHGMPPSFILMTSDVAQAVFREVETNNKYKGVVKAGLPNMPMTFDLGSGPIEVGQIVGVNRVELVIDPTMMKIFKP